MRGRSHRGVVKSKVWVESSGRFVVGDGGVHLLSAIGKTGSIRSAAARVGWSYRHALDYLNNAEHAFGRTLVDRVRGGNERGGARLTDDGRRFLDGYTTFRKRLEAEVARLAGETLATVL